MPDHKQKASITFYFIMSRARDSYSSKPSQLNACVTYPEKVLKASYLIFIFNTFLLKWTTKFP